MGKIMAALGALFAIVTRTVTRTVETVRHVGGRAVRSFEAVTELVVDRTGGIIDAAADVGRAVGKLGVGVVSDVVKMPFRVLGTIGAAGMNLAGKGVPQAPTPQQAAAAEAAKQKANAAEEARRIEVADKQAEARELLTAVRSVAKARSLGEEPDRAALGRLPTPVSSHLLGLDRGECERIAAGSVAALRGLLRGTAPSGVRSPQQVADAVDASHRPQAASNESDRASRKAEIRGAVREAVSAQRLRRAAEEADADEAMLRSLQLA